MSNGSTVLLGEFIFPVCFMHHEPKYFIGIKDEKVTPHFSDPKAWELTPLLNILLSALSLHKRKVGISKILIIVLRGSKHPEQFSELLEHQSILPRDFGDHLAQHLHFFI